MLTAKVVILNWNGSEMLRRFLPSVVRNTPAGVEVVVADNGSTDDSAVMLGEDFPTVRVIRLDRNYGYAGGYNKALADDCFDGTEILVLLNSDVETPAGWLEPLLGRFDSNPVTVACSPKILSYENKDRFEYAGASGGFIDGFGYPFCRGRIMNHVERDHGQYDDARKVFWASGACLAVRNRVFRELGGFDESFFAHMEEIDFCWRAQTAGHEIWVEPRSSVYHLGGGTLDAGSPRKLYLNFRNNLTMMCKNLSGITVLPVMLCRMVLDGLSALVYLLTGRFSYFRSVFRAHMGFWKRLPATLRKRRAIQRNRRAKPFGIYCGSILLRYYMGRKEFGDLL